VARLPVDIDPHARERMLERGATEEEVVSTIHEGERFPAKYGRTGFRRNFRFEGVWRGRSYGTKQLEVFAVDEDGRWVVITVIARFF
jgi:hypothetical protein